MVETGRYKEYRIANGELRIADLQAAFWKQVEHCQSTVLDGPGKRMRWGVPDGTRNEATGELVHDDLLVSAAICIQSCGLDLGV